MTAPIPLVRQRCTLACVLIGIAALFSVIASGCGRGDDNLPQTVPVSGRVEYQGKPIGEGTVTFHPVGEGNPAVGLLDEQGRYELSTYRRGDGAVLGEHRVTIDIPPTLDGSPPRFSVPRQYTDPERTPLVVEVSPERKNIIELFVADP